VDDDDGREGVLVGSIGGGGAANGRAAEELMRDLSFCWRRCGTKDSGLSEVRDLFCGGREVADEYAGGSETKASFMAEREKEKRTTTVIKAKGRLKLNL